MDQVWDDLESGAIHLRDKWQFELKSEFTPLHSSLKNHYTQEFFLFIPNSLQINRWTYTKAQFYEDQTTLIRYKTPEFTFTELLDPNNEQSPLAKIKFLVSEPTIPPPSFHLIEDELKLYGNIFRSTLRSKIKELIHLIDVEKMGGRKGLFTLETKQLILDLKSLKKYVSEIKEDAIRTLGGNLLLNESFHYLEDFCGNTINHFLTRLLDILRLAYDPALKSLDQEICELLLDEVDSKRLEALVSDPKNKEYILYRQGLLNKYILDALLLTINRLSIDEKYQNWIGAISAGIAMFIYFCLFIWLGEVFLIDSVPFILFTVIIYILKDRIKEWLKQQSYQQAFKFFFDYRTEIETSDQKRKLGILKESFCFIEEEKLSSEIVQIRNKEFHQVLEAIARPESVIYFKRTVEINQIIAKHAPRRHELNVIYRFNIHRFLLKASNPHETYVSLDPNTLKLLTHRLPKVYHLNLIIKNTFTELENKTRIEFSKLRIVIDKNGIKRIEQL